LNFIAGGELSHGLAGCVEYKNIAVAAVISIFDEGDLAFFAGQFTLCSAGGAARKEKRNERNSEYEGQYNCKPSSLVQNESPFDG
jgi:hypothetical protein